MSNSSTFERIKIGIASPNDIRSWSHGEVKKPETINYRTFKPERDGLFCERIFGPTRDWECHCGRYKKIKFKNIVCDRCGVEVTKAKVRRDRMGHIELVAPVSHVWYLKGVPSPLSLLLDIAPRPLEKVLYYASYIVTAVDRTMILDSMHLIEEAIQEEVNIIKNIGAPGLAALDRPLVVADEDEDPHIDADSIPIVEDVEEPVELEDVEEVHPVDVDDLVDDEPVKVPSASAVRRQQKERNVEDRVTEMLKTGDLLRTIQPRQLITEGEYQNIQRILEIVVSKTDASRANMVKAGLGAASIKSLLEEIDLDKLSRELKKEVKETQGARRARIIKRLEYVEAFRKSQSRPEWMVLDAIPVIPPELRPMVQLDGGRFATSDLNDLYRRIINRNNRLKKITDIRAPDSIINHEKRLLQEAVDALIDNTRRSRPVTGSNGRPLRSLSDMLKGKEGRFRKNLLGKRVDYSGRSVIVVGPDLKLGQCGMPKEMALELFKPFVMKTLVERDYTPNIKTAKKMIDKMQAQVWDALEDVIREHPVLLNRAPTLHRLGIQAFQPVLVDGKAIQLHPLVCHAFNADFDGDQMPAHVPLGATAQAEARILMMSTQNLFSPADGRPIVAPIQDIVLGLYYLTQEEPGAKGEGQRFSTVEDATVAHALGEVALHAKISVHNLPWVKKTADNPTQGVEAPFGRFILVDCLPDEMRPAYIKKELNKKSISEMVSECFKIKGNERTVKLLDDVKTIGFFYATQSGVTIAMHDLVIPEERDRILDKTDQQVYEINQQFEQGFLAPSDRSRQIVQLWSEAYDQVGKAIMDNLERRHRFNPVFMVMNSGARGSTKQFTQLAGMRGLMADPFGNMIEDLPIKNNFHHGLNILEFFVSTHGARKGLTDTALRTADAGYLTRRLVDVAQDVIVRADDCGTVHGIRVRTVIRSGDVMLTLKERLYGRIAATESVVDPETGEILTEVNTEISDDVASRLDEIDTQRRLRNEQRRLQREVGDANVSEDEPPISVALRSPLTCELKLGICAMCYGRDLATNRPVEVGTAAGIIAAQSIGEPGTQLTMRTFHTGGIAGDYITQATDVKGRRQEALRNLYGDPLAMMTGGGEEGLEKESTRSIQEVLKVLEEPIKGLHRVVELFEARKPKGQAIVNEHDGTVVSIEMDRLKRVTIRSQISIDSPEASKATAAEPIINPESGEVVVDEGQEISERERKRLKESGVHEVAVLFQKLVPQRGRLDIRQGQAIEAGARLTEGPLDPQRVLELKGLRGVEEYLVTEVQEVYKSQAISINDKHIEIIVRQMLKKRKILDAGDTDFLPGQTVDKFDLEEENRRVHANGGSPAASEFLLLGITEASLATDSFLSAASFQKTTKVLTDAAVKGKRDYLVGLKENVIIGRLIPAGTGTPQYKNLKMEVPEGALPPPPPARDRDRLLALPDDIRQSMDGDVSDVASILNLPSILDDLANEVELPESAYLPEPEETDEE